MNYVKEFLRSRGAILVLLSLILFFDRLYGQSPRKERAGRKAAELKEMVNGRNFVFKAQFALPMGGSSIQLTSEYDVKIKKDTLVCFLPYFGRAYTAPMNPAEGGYRFTSANYDYAVKSKRKGGWDIVVKPRDIKNLQQMIFYVSETGYGSLQITDNNRQPISFNGYYEKNKDKKE